MNVNDSRKAGVGLATRGNCSCGINFLYHTTIPDNDGHDADGTVVDIIQL